MTDTNTRVTEAIAILKGLDFPKQQQNERSGLCLLALCNVGPDTPWSEASASLLGIAPIMDWMAENYDKIYKTGSRESVRRKTMHQFVEAGLALYNPDDPARPVNSPAAVYQIAPEALALIKLFGSDQWAAALATYSNDRDSLADKYAKPRTMEQVPVNISGDQTINLSPGAHNDLIKATVEEFAPRFLPGATLIYVGDTGSKVGFFEKQKLVDLGVEVDPHGKFPDVVFHYTEKDWLVLVESVTSHGPVDGKRHQELADLFAQSRAGLVFVTAFPDRKMMARYISDISWETEVWCAEAPSHLIHFNGERFLGPYKN